MSAIAAFLLGLLFTCAGTRVLRLAARLASAVLCAGVAGHYDLDPLGLSFPLGFLLGDALYHLVFIGGGAAVGALLGFGAGGAAGAVAGAVAGAALALLFERPLAIVALAWLAAWLLSFLA